MKKYLLGAFFYLLLFSCKDIANDPYSNFIISNTSTADKKASEITLEDFTSKFDDLCKEFPDLQKTCRAIASLYGSSLGSPISEQLLTSMKPIETFFHHTSIKFNSPFSNQSTELLYNGKSRGMVLKFLKHTRTFKRICDKYDAMLASADSNSLGKISLFNALPSSLRSFKETDLIFTISSAFENLTTYLVNRMPDLNKYEGLDPTILDEELGEGELVFQEDQEEENPFTPELTEQQRLESNAASALSDFFKELNEDDLKKKINLIA